MSSVVHRQISDLCLGGGLFKFQTAERYSCLRIFATLLQLAVRIIFQLYYELFLPNRTKFIAQSFSHRSYINLRHFTLQNQSNFLRLLALQVFQIHWRFRDHSTSPLSGFWYQKVDDGDGVGIDAEYSDILIAVKNKSR